MKSTSKDSEASNNLRIAFKAGVVNNISINKTHSILTVKPHNDFVRPEPGQFYMLKVGDLYDPLLRRPLSTFSSDRGLIRFLYKIKGKGTKILAGMNKGSELDILGPLGNAYPMPNKGESPLLVAGGIGIASLFYFLTKLNEKPVVVFGARDKDELVMLDEVRAFSKDVVVYTDNGSVGKTGTVLDALKNMSFKKNTVLYACGSKPMLKAVSMFALNKGLKGYVSLDEYMACGLGACLGCAVKTNDGYKRVCKEGPVFEMDYIDWKSF